MSENQTQDELIKKTAEFITHISKLHETETYGADSAEVLTFVLEEVLKQIKGKQAVKEKILENILWDYKLDRL